MAFERVTDQPETTKLECTTTHLEEAPVSSESNQEQYARRKIDARTAAGILVTSIHHSYSYFIGVNDDAGSGSHVRSMLVLIHTSRFGTFEH